MKIYTKTGDKGMTSLFGGKRVFKNDVRLESYGTIDELNSLIGVALNKVETDESKKILRKVQNDLFVLGSDLSTPEETKYKVPRVAKEMVDYLEEQIDLIDGKIPQLKTFILPGGSEGASILQFVRTVCRRAERRTVELQQLEQINETAIVYLNRLSDLLFVLSRFENISTGTPEIEWQK